MRGRSVAKMKLIVQLVLVALLGLSVKAEDPEKIVGGFAAAAGELPYQVSIRYQGQHLCGGSIIGASHILSAAHCFQDIPRYNFNGLTVVSGTTNIYAGGQTHRVTNIQNHPRYVNSVQASWANDVSILTLQRPMTFNEYQRSIPLASSDTVANTPARVSGWGKTSAQGPLSGRLLKVDTTIISNQYCQQVIPNRIYPTQLCTFKAVGSGACSGDSGGPLVANGQLVGIVSWVYPCAVGRPDVFTRVYSFRTFITNAQISG